MDTGPRMELHVPDDIKQNGPASVTYSGVVEHQYVTSKEHAARTRKHLEALDKELGDRMQETIIINETYKTMKSVMKLHSQD
mmetsp:Transcript_4918/g.7582  ORF Transcript_4918/g.7582 Transcript_4918/m.7582 type:complete len:82 (-) Transcript_4918:554-799(-)